MFNVQIYKFLLTFTSKRCSIDVGRQGGDIIRIQVNISDKLVSEIDEYAKAVGMTRSSLCAYFIGQGIFGIKEGVKLGEKILLSSTEKEPTK